MTNGHKNSAIEEDQTDAHKRRAQGEFVRGVSEFRSSIGDDQFPAEEGRYHLFVALNCPWCHRVVLARNVLGLATSISLDIAFPTRTDENHPDGGNLWQFAPEKISALTGDILTECTDETATGRNLPLIKDIYALEGSQERSVPILFDKTAQRIVSNESAEIIRMLNTNASELGSTLDQKTSLDLYPNDKQKEIDDLNQLIYISINNGAYKAGFSSDQSVYAAAFKAYFETLAHLDNLLSDGRAFLTGEEITEADLRLFPTLYRHDPIYYLRMKLNGAKILNYPHLWRWLCRVYAFPGVAESNSLTHCRQGYFGRSWNGTIPLGPFLPMSYPEAYKHPELARKAP